MKKDVLSAIKYIYHNLPDIPDLKCFTSSGGTR